MSEAYKKLVKTLRTLFEMDKADLDFGIYRILNQKRDEISRFLDEDLLPQVKAAFADYAGGGKAELQAELEQAIEQAKHFGAPDPEQAPPVLAIKAKLASAVDVTAVENEVYSHLHTFFSRYYDQGDFISQRRYKADTYAIPYEGEEVKLYWANHDQYYVKSSEHLRDYAFTVHDDDGRTVRIKLIEADTEKDNVKAAADQERRFVLDAEQPLHLEGGELQIRFQYVPAGRKKQDALNAEAVATIFAQKGYADWLNLLRKPAPTEANPKRTLLEKHLNDYTARNTFDYFIHKDLGGFLRRELDFYIKSEVLHLDDVDDAAFAVTEAHVRKIKVLRSIAHKIIRMLAQIESFQKVLWLKRKFVVAVDYCVTMDRVPEELHEQIVKCDAQWQEWISLNIAPPDRVSEEAARRQFLAEHSHAMVDTRHFSAEFRSTFVASMSGAHDEIDGLLVHADNFHAISILQAAYANRVDCIYLDPPYNTDATPILYKNGFRSSSWTSLMRDRIALSRALLKKTGITAVAIDDTQLLELRFLLSNLLPGGILGTFAIRANPSGRPMQTGYSVAHEYTVIAGQADASIGRMPPTEAQLSRFNQTDHKGKFEWRNLRREGSNSDRGKRKFLFYPIYVTEDSLRVPRLSWDQDAEQWNALEQPRTTEEVVYPLNDEGIEKTWRWGWEKVARSGPDLAVRKDRSGKNYPYYKRRPHEDGVVAVSTWFDAKYSATEYGTALIKSLFGANSFDYPKSLHAVKDIVYISGGRKADAVVLDFFAGSGTTAHAVIELNADYGGHRKFILVDVERHFETVLIPRLKKISFSRRWTNGKPVSGGNGLSQCVKYLRLESYEDALNNLLVRARTKRQQDMLDDNPSLREDYMLGYWLDVETADSPSLLTIDQFEDPFNYKLNIATGSVGAFKPTVVDLVETFNYLIGLRVKHIDTIRGFKIVTGTNPQDESVLVIWRRVKEQDNAALEDFMDKQGYNPRDTEFDRIYVNGDHTLEDPHSKVKMTEIEFKRLMFDVQDV